MLDDAEKDDPRGNYCVMSRLSPLLLVLPVLAAISGCTESIAHLTPPESRIEISQVTLDPEKARAAINRYRASKGLKPLSLDPKLAIAAQRHSTDLARRDKLSHKGADGSNPWSRVEKAGYSPKLAAENVGAGQRSIEEVIQGWRASAGHDRNLLLPDATHMGIALVKDPSTSYGAFWTLVLATPM